MLSNWTGSFDKDLLTDLKEWWAKADYSLLRCLKRTNTAKMPIIQTGTEYYRSAGLIVNLTILSINITCHSHVLTDEII